MTLDAKVREVRRLREAPSLKDYLVRPHDEELALFKSDLATQERTVLRSRTRGPRGCGLR